MQTFKIASLIILVHAGVLAQSADSLIRMAFKNNPQLTAISHQADAAEHRAASVGAMPAPTFGIEFSQVPTSSANILNDAISNNISLSQMFMLGGKLSLMSEMERKKGALLQHAKASLLVKLRASVRMNYIQLWLLDRQIEIRHRTIHVLDELAGSLASGVQTNRTQSADLLTVRAEAASERARIAELGAKRRAINNVLVSLTAPQPAFTTTTDSRSERVSAYTREGAAGTITPDSVLPALPPFSSEADLAAALLDDNPTLATMDGMKQMNDLEIAAAKKELIPDLMLQAMVMRMPNGMILTGGQRSVDMIQMSADGMPTKNTEWMYSVMASVTLPFMPWSSQRSTAKTDELRSMNLNVDSQKLAMEREMVASLRSAVNTFETQDSLSRLYRETILPLMRDAAQARTVSYQTGRAPLSALLETYRMELMKTDDYLMTIMNAQMAFIDIEMMVGVPLH